MSAIEDLDLFEDTTECEHCGKSIFYERVLIGNHRVRATWKHTYLANEYCSQMEGFNMATPRMVRS